MTSPTRRAALFTSIAMLAGLGACATPDLSAPARANLADLLSDEDYPAAATRAEEEGTVAFRLDVAADGSVSACTVTSSSGSATLDAATCRIMRYRAHFTPALDRKGRPTTDEVNSRVRWVLPS
jgi:protein TonB